MLLVNFSSKTVLNFAHWSGVIKVNAAAHTGDLNPRCVICSLRNKSCFLGMPMKWLMHLMSFFASYLTRLD